jgi:hypothetical protein
LVQKMVIYLLFYTSGTTFRPTLVAFSGKERLCGEEALPQVAGESTVPMINQLLGRTLADIEKSDPLSLQHRKLPVAADVDGRLVVNMTYGEEKQQMHIAALMGLFIARLKARVQEVVSEEYAVANGTTLAAAVEAANGAGAPFPYLSLALPPNFQTNTHSVERGYRESCQIAGVDASKLFVCDAADCLVATYARKLNGLEPFERAHLEGKYVLILDMGHLHTTAGLFVFFFCFLYLDFFLCSVLIHIQYLLFLLLVVSSGCVC